MSHLPHVTVQVLPFEAGAHPGMSGQFAILEFTDATDATVVYLEGVTSDLYLEKDTDVQSVQRDVRASAGPGAERGARPGSSSARRLCGTPEPAAPVRRQMGTPRVKAAKILYCLANWQDLQGICHLVG